MTSNAWARLLALGALFIAADFVLGYVGVPLRIDSIDASPVWLPHGLSLAAILVLGPRFWPAILSAVVVRALWGGLPLSVAVGLGLATVVEVLLASYLMRGPGGFTGTLDTIRGVIAFVLGGAVVASVAGAILSVAWLTANGLASWSRCAELATTWWLGDAMGALIVVPPVLAVVTPRRWSFDRSSVTALALIGTSLLAAGELAFGRLLPPVSGLPFAYLPFPFIFWASLRFGVHGAAVASSLAAVHATIGTLRGLGPFAREAPQESLLLLEAFMAVMILTGLLLGAVIQERRSVAHALRDSQKRHRLASSAGRAGVWDWHIASDAIYVDPVLKNILGYEDHEIANTIEDWEKLIHPEDVELVHRASRRHLDGETRRLEIEHRMVHRDGSIRWFLTRGEAQRDDAGVAIRLTGTDVDITHQKRTEAALEAGEQRIQEQLSELEHIYQTAPIGLALTDLDHRFVRINERLAAMNGWSVEQHIGRTIRELMPNVADLVEPAMRRVIETGEPHIEEVETATPRWSGTALVGHYPLEGEGGAVHGVGVIVQDITGHKSAEQTQAGNNRALELVASGSSLDEVMDLLARNVESSTGKSCIIWLVSNGGRSLTRIAASSLPSRHDTAIDLIPVGVYGGSCGESVRTRKPTVSAAISSDPSWASLRSAAKTLGLESCCSVPILGSTDEVLGAVGLFGRETGAPNEADLDAGENAAHLARVAIEHARAREALTKSESSLRESHEQVQRLAQRLIAAQEQERRRVSRELHDGLNQQLAALSFEIGKLRTELTTDDPAVGERLSELQNRAVHLIDEARRMSHELHPSMLEHLGLVAAVRAYCDEESERHDGLNVRFDPIRPPESIAPETALCLFRVVQEGVRNAAKHSGASAVQVTLRSSHGSLLLAIADNGNGFETGDDRNGGLGLVSMAERVRAIGGEFRIFSDAREGTRLEVRVPVRAPVSAQPAAITSAPSGARADG